MVVRREVEVYADWSAHPPDRGRWQCGSGYLLAGRLVLTAAHVVCPAGQVLSRVQVRAQSGGLVDAAVVWHRCVGDVDVALLVIRDRAWVEPVWRHPVRWGRLVTTRAGQRCEAVVLGGEVLLVGGTACIADEKRRHGAPPEVGPARHDAAAPTATEAATLNFAPAVIARKRIRDRTAPGGHRVPLGKGRAVWASSGDRRRHAGVSAVARAGPLFADPLLFAVWTDAVRPGPTDRATYQHCSPHPREAAHFRRCGWDCWSRGSPAWAPRWRLPRRWCTPW
ncbi:MAG: hypothetical protein ACRDRK_07505 [Pseudonocardia sp.]